MNGDLIISDKKPSYENSNSNEEDGEPDVLNEKNEILLNNKFSVMEFSKLTIINLSHRYLEELPKEMSTLKHVTFLDLSYNAFKVIPSFLHEGMFYIEKLDISYNELTEFNSTPCCLTKLKVLQIQGNFLDHFPEWMWNNETSILEEYNISENYSVFGNMTKDYRKTYSHKTLKRLDIKLCSYQENCIFDIPNIQVLHIGERAHFYQNCIAKFPCNSFSSKLNKLNILNLENVNLSVLAKCISSLNQITNINLSDNCLQFLPDEFCNLDNLEICNLSKNNFVCLPHNFGRLKSLKTLYLTSNKLKYLPVTLCESTSLRELDCYDNELEDCPRFLTSVESLDLAWNHCDEPSNQQYKTQKHKIRGSLEFREDGSKKCEVNSKQCLDEAEDKEDSSSEEDWESDSYWEPHEMSMYRPNPAAAWEYFLRKKMEEGNFCPADNHVPPIVSTQPPGEFYPVQGQFDDASEEES